VATAPREVAAAAEEFIEPGLVRQAEYPMDGPVAAIKPVYDVLRRWSETSGTPGGAAHPRPRRCS
jgi:hypothetical protein